MSTLKSSTSTIDELMKTLEDGVKGFELCAEKLEGSPRKDVRDLFRKLGAERVEFRNELGSIANKLGHGTDDSGTVGAKLERGWIGIKDFVSATDAERILDTAEKGERHAVSVFEDAMEEDLTPDLRAVVKTQLAAVRSSYEQVASLASAAS
jgi:uncharacterized protein (TIGR02284 family)